MTKSDQPARRHDAWDVALGCICLAVAIAVHVGGSEAVARNLEPSAFSVMLTALAVGPLVVRRRYPLAVLVVTLIGLIGLIATRNTVGASTIGCTVAFYTAVAVGSRREVRTALEVMAVGVIIGLLLRPVDLSRSGAAVNLAVFVGAWVLAAGVRQRRARFEADVLATEERAAHNASEERLRITRELHDVIGHSLSLMVVQAGVAERLLDTDPQRARAAIAQIGVTGRSSLLEMRQMLNVLRDGSSDGREPLPLDPMPTLAQLPDLLARVEGAGLAATLFVHGTPSIHTPGLELAAYRITQEALTNCVKHASATRVQVEVDHGPQALTVTVTDNGRGSSDAKPFAGQGLAGMRERIAVYDGRLSVGPDPAGGFRVQARFPLPGAVPTGSRP